MLRLITSSELLILPFHDLSPLPPSGDEVLSFTMIASRPYGANLDPTARTYSPPSGSSVLGTDAVSRRSINVANAATSAAVKFG